MPKGGFSFKLLR
uniref:Uncharacterized protein n=1 Tax=Anguilla anguilla TaxID=7936 RepID=A0A0E9U8K4_ANGAN